MNKRQKAKIITQCKEILANRYIDANRFVYTVTEETYFYHVDVSLYNNSYFQFTSIFLDDNYNILQFTLEFS